MIGGHSSVVQHIGLSPVQLNRAPRFKSGCSLRMHDKPRIIISICFSVCRSTCHLVYYTEATLRPRWTILYFVVLYPGFILPDDSALLLRSSFVLHTLRTQSSGTYKISKVTDKAINRIYEQFLEYNGIYPADVTLEAGERLITQVVSTEVSVSKTKYAQVPDKNPILSP